VRFALPFLRRACVAAALCAVAIPAHAADVVHVVAKGQTLGRIARRYNISIDTLREVNQLARGAPIRPGLVLVIPEKGKEKEALQRAATKRAATVRSDTAAKSRKEPGATRERKDPASYVKKPKKPGFVQLVRGAERAEIQLLTRHGRLVPTALPALTKILRHGSGSQTPIDPRLATLLGMVSDRFGGRQVTVVSGYRPYSPTQYTPHSNHNFGRAVDFYVDGVPNTVVRDYCRSFRNAGVGYYPNSTFVHLDVRSGKVYWVDHAGPGEPPRYEGGQTHAPDEAARDVATGSSRTQPGPTQPLEGTTGFPETEDTSRPNSTIPGHSRPPISPSAPHDPGQP
jgi:uncharacterized protein YcbK (DUF882 family)